MNLDEAYSEASAPEQELSDLGPDDVSLDGDDVTMGANEEIRSQSVNTQGTRKNSSSVWLHFDKYMEGNVQKARCKKCNASYVANGTTNCKKHLEKQCPFRINRGVSREFNQRVCRKLLTSAVVRHNLPFKFVEYKGIRKWLSYMNPAVKHISRNTLKSDVLAMYTREKEKLKKELQSVSSRVSLTSDLWTSPKTNGFMTVTAHYIDNEWSLQRRILTFRNVPPPHDGHTIGHTLHGYLEDWGIDGKIFSLTLDNASYNQIVINSLKTSLASSLLCNGDFLHVRCGAHILNLIVMEGLKVIDLAVYKIRETVKYIRASEGRVMRLVDCIRRLRLDVTKSLKQDISTRWNSTYLMLDSAIPYRAALTELAKIDRSYGWCPSPEEWIRVEKISALLKPFYDITVTLSGSKYPTANLYFINIWKIQLLIRDELMSGEMEEGEEDGGLKEIAKGMKEKFDKYWDSYSPILSMAFVLDPRYELRFVELAYQKVDATTSQRKVRELREKMESLYKEYSEVASDSTASSSRVVYTSKADEYMDEIDAILSQGERDRTTSQLERYLSEPLMDRKKYADLDVLGYWKQNQDCPALARMARDVLCIPVTTVASESAFSLGGRVISIYRSSILPKNAEAVICLRDWLEAYDHDDEEDEEELEIDIPQMLGARNAIP